MASTNTSLTEAWSSALKAGPASVNIQNKSSSAMISYAVAGSAPAATVTHVNIGPGQTHPVLVASGENLYARAIGTGAAAEVCVIDA